MGPSEEQVEKEPILCPQQLYYGYSYLLLLILPFPQGACPSSEQPCGRLD